MSKALLRVCIGAIAFVLVAACTPSKRTTKVDDSVEYQSARALPPLKYNRNQAVAVGRTESQSAPATSTTPLSYDASPAQVPTDTASLVTNEVTAELLNTSRGATRLRIMASNEVAWAYVRDQAKTAGLSIFSRDYGSGRLYIGCAGLEQAEVEKKGRWTFFKREKTEVSDHCALALESSASETMVRVLNRQGEEVSGDGAKSLLASLINSG